MNILVTGGTGYIGSHVVVELLEQRHNVVILDNLSCSQYEVLEKIQAITGIKPTFYNNDLTNISSLEQVFNKLNFDLVIHLAGLKAVAESIKQPIDYYNNNIVGTLNLLKVMESHSITNFIFSSSASVYGNQKNGKCSENMSTGIGITNPYSKTKYIIEEILKDLSASNSKFSAISLRYFNPIGNHQSGLLGENINGVSNNLMSSIIKVALGELPELEIFGNDYKTPDGTCLRDFIHVTDLAKGHLASIKRLCPGFKIYNLGTGHPTSILEVVHAFEKISGLSLPYRFAPRRPGDLPIIFADPEKAERELHWHADLTVEDAIKDVVTYLRHK